MNPNPESHAPESGGGLPAVPYRFTVHLGGLIELLSDALYARESVFLRELIQNAVDAIFARRALEPEHGGKVRIQFFQGDDGRWRLVVKDDGIGLDEGEVHGFLATIGASMKRGEWAQRRAEGFIGQFGVGFLSCFLVADEVTLVTRRAAQPGARTLKWEGRRDGNYTVVELATDRSPGSAVYLTLKDVTREEYNGDRLFALAQRYAGYLEVPIEFTSAETGRVQVNPDPFPWLKSQAKRGDRQREWLAFAERRTGARFLAVFSFGCEEENVTGLVGVSADPVGVLDSSRHVVFLKGMFLSAEVEGVAPADMPFLRCIVNATRLRPNAAREGLQDAETSLAAVRNRVRRGFLAFLGELEGEDPALWKEFLRVHNRSLVELAGQDPEVLGRVGPHLRLQTSLGMKSLQELRSEKGVKWFIESYEDFKRIEGYAASHRIPVVNAGYAGIDRLMRRVAAEWSGANFRATDSATLQSLTAREAEYSPALHGLLQRARRTLSKVRATAALRSDPRGRSPATVEVPVERSLHRGASGSAPGFLEELEFGGAGLEITLHLNASHPLIQLLSEPSHSENRVSAVVMVLYHQALVAAREIPSSRESQLFDHALEVLLLGGEVGGRHG